MSFWFIYRKVPRPDGATSGSNRPQRGTASLKRRSTHYLRWHRVEIFHRRRSFASLPLSERHSAMISPKSTRYMSNAMGRFWPRFATSWVILIPVPFPVRASHASQYMCRSFAMLGSSRLLEIYCHEDDLRSFLPLQTVVTHFIQHASQDPQCNRCRTCSGPLRVDSHHAGNYVGVDRDF